MLKERIAQKGPDSQGETDYEEYAIFFTYDDPSDFIARKDIDKYIQDYIKEHRYRRGALKAEAYQVVCSDDHNNRVDGIKIVTHSSEQDCSVNEWSKRFYEFLVWLMAKMCTRIRFGRYQNYDKNQRPETLYYR